MPNSTTERQTNRLELVKTALNAGKYGEAIALIKADTFAREMDSYDLTEVERLVAFMKLEGVDEKSRYAAVQEAEKATRAALHTAPGVALPTDEGARASRAAEQAAFPDMSTCNPLGERDHPRPKLVDARGHQRNVFYCYQLMNDFLPNMTAAEIEGFNAIQTNCECRDGVWKAEIVPATATALEELHVTLPLGSADAVQGLPPLRDILYELRTGEPPTKTYGQ